MTRTVDRGVSSDRGGGDFVGLKEGRREERAKLGVGYSWLVPKAVHERIGVSAYEGTELVDRFGLTSAAGRGRWQREDEEAEEGSRGALDSGPSPAPLIPPGEKGAVQLATFLKCEQRSSRLS
jgi:hypothetical protein